MKIDSLSQHLLMSIEEEKIVEEKEY